MVSMVEIGRIHEKVLSEEEKIRLEKWHKEIEYKMKMYCGGDKK